MKSFGYVHSICVIQPTANLEKASEQAMEQANAFFEIGPDNTSRRVKDWDSACAIQVEYKRYVRTQHRHFYWFDAQAINGRIVGDSEMKLPAAPSVKSDQSPVIQACELSDEPEMVRASALMNGNVIKYRGKTLLVLAVVGTNGSNLVNVVATENQNDTVVITAHLHYRFKKFGIMRGQTIEVLRMSSTEWDAQADLRMHE